MDRRRCLLEQGVACCGVATAAGCEAVCPRGGSPCIGCLGLVGGGEDFALGMVTALAALVDRREWNSLERLERAGLSDPAGLFRQFNLGHRMMRRRLARAREVTPTPPTPKRR